VNLVFLPLHTYHFWDPLSHLPLGTHSSSYRD
jgi:hypothetical protein